MEPSQKEGWAKERAREQNKSCLEILKSFCQTKNVIVCKLCTNLFMDKWIFIGNLLLDLCCPQLDKKIDLTVIATTM